MDYESDTVFVTGVAKPSQDDPIASTYQVFFVSLIVELSTGRIVDSTCNADREMTNRFIRSMLVGRNLLIELDAVVAEIRRRFFGLVQKPLIVAVKDAHNRFALVRRERETG